MKEMKTIIMDDFNTIIKENKPVLVDFYADWCGPCQTMYPIIEDIKHIFGNQIRILKINVDKNQTISQRFKIQSIPTLLLFSKGEIEWRTAGIHTRAEIKKKIEQILQQHE